MSIRNMSKQNASYVPPHKRNTQRKTDTHKMNFPQLTTPKPIQESNMDFKKLFKNVEKKRIKREHRMKKGWIKLSKHGQVDSLTPEERASEEEWNIYKRTQSNLDNLVLRWDKHTEMRYERDGYLSDYSVDLPSEEEEEPEESEEESSEEEDILEYDSKWFTS
jgi:hypothetical protein